MVILWTNDAAITMVQVESVLNKVIEHARNHSYMSGVGRDKLRIKATGEVFTPTPLVQEILEQLPPELFTDPTKTFIDPSCGDGQFLSEVLIRKMENGIDFETALSTIYGVELMPDNAKLCRERLLCGESHLAHIVERNIFEADFLVFAPLLEHLSWDEACLQYPITMKDIKDQEREKLEKESLEKERNESREAIHNILFNPK